MLEVLAVSIGAATEDGAAGTVCLNDGTADMPRAGVAVCTVVDCKSISA